MKIEIEFKNSYEAKLTIDGREMIVKSQPGIVSLEGIDSPDSEETLGGIIASELYTKVADFQQAWLAADEEQEGCGTWDRLSDDAAEAAGDRVW